MLAKRIGLSKRKLMVDVARGELKVRWVKCGQSKMAMVQPEEVDRYLRQIGVLDAPSIRA